MMDESGTYLEDFLLSLELLPNDFRRDFELMKELDKESCEMNKDLLELEKNYLNNLKLVSTKSASALDKEEKDGILLKNVQLMDEINSLKERCSQKLSEKTAIATNLTNIIDRFGRKLDTDLAFFETELKGCGDFDTPKGAEPGSEVAFRLENADPAVEKCMILGRVIFYHIDTACYDILDVDDSKKYLLPENQVVVLDSVDSSRKLSKGEAIFALYPDTTSFYMAVISQAPRRTAVGVEPTVVVQFIGDEDITGLIPHRIVPLKYVVRPQEGELFH